MIDRIKKMEALEKSHLQNEILIKKLLEEFKRENKLDSLLKSLV